MPGQVHAEERQLGVGHRIDEPAHEAARACGRSRRYCAAEGHDPRVGGGAGGLRQPARPRPAQKTARARRVGSAPSWARRTSPRAVVHRVTASAEEHLAARGVDLARHGAGDGREVDDPGVRASAARRRPRSAARPPRARRRSGAAGPGRRWPAAPLELVEARELAVVQRDDDLPAALGGDAVLFAVVVQPCGALDAQPRLERARGVVDARMDDAAVVAVWPAATRDAPSTTARRRPGRRASSSRAVASPMIPAPTMARS